MNSLYLWKFIRGKWSQPFSQSTHNLKKKKKDLALTEHLPPIREACYMQTTFQSSTAPLSEGCAPIRQEIEAWRGQVWAHATKNPQPPSPHTPLTSPLQLTPRTPTNRRSNRRPIQFKHPFARPCTCLAQGSHSWKSLIPCL